MRLRKQLFFLSLVTLALPWVGCQYIQEMDAALRQGQADALTATATAVSARLSSDPELNNTLKQYTQLHRPLYAHKLSSPLIIDGYDGDWMSQGYAYTPFATPSSNDDKEKIILGSWQNALYVVIKIQKDTLRYFNPSQTSLDHCDHIVLGVGDDTYALFASTPGRLKAALLNDRQLPFQEEHQIKGFWLEKPNGYQVEFQLPLAWMAKGLSVISQDETTITRKRIAPTTQAVVSLSDLLSNELSIFSSPGTRLYITSDKAQIVASAGNLKTNVDQGQHGFVEWLYTLVLGNRNFPQLQTRFDRGVFESEDIHRALAGSNTQSWHQRDQQAVARAALPVLEDRNLDPIAAVVAEQSAAPLTNMTNSALNRLLAYSVIASTFAGICLVIYATWLSLRIRKLSEAAANAISESGKINDKFPVSQSKDEIGDLSRSYEQLLSRLREYTNYLRTLSSKLSHELRTPLAIVRSSLDNLEHEKLSKQAKTYAERAREGTTRLSNILNSMSAASRVEQAIGASEREVIPCDELLSNLKDAYVDVYQHTRFELNIRKDGKDLSIFGSGELLVQALDKLVDNAADFCGDEGLIELGLYRHQETIVFTVRNEGPPLPSHMHGQLFDSMVSVREKPAGAEEGHHLGLGLYIVRLITDFHHGEVQGYNIPDNSGVIFEIRIPAARE